MCFSAEASFVSGAVLTAVGVASLRETISTSQIAFACIPLLFGVQQISEGFVWLSLTDPDFAVAEHAAVLIFLIFAQVFWPLWVALSILLLEKERTRKIMLYIISAMGLITSVYLAYRLYHEHVPASIADGHIVYHFAPVSSFIHYFGVMYFIATVFPPFISSLKKMWMLGSAILLSYILSKIFFGEALISVWCFFAAVISIVVYFIMRMQRSQPG